MIVVDKLSDRAKCERASEIKGLRKRVGFLPKIGLCLGKEDPDWKIRIGRRSGLEDPDLEEDPVELARKKLQKAAPCFHDPRLFPRDPRRHLEREKAPRRSPRQVR